MVKKQKRHIRTSKRGKKFVAGSKKRARPCQINQSMKRQIVQDYMSQTQIELKRKGRARLPQLGVLRLKKIPAKKGGKKIMMFGKPVITKAKPASKKIKFSAAKALKEAI